LSDNILRKTPGATVEKSELLKTAGSPPYAGPAVSKNN